MTDSPNDATQDLFQAAYDNLGDAAMQALRTQAGVACNTYLLTFKDPANYGEFRHMAATFADSILVWAIAEGWVIPAEKANASPDELAARKAVPPAREVALRAVPESGGYA